MAPVAESTVRFPRGARGMAARLPPLDRGRRQGTIDSHLESDVPRTSPNAHKRLGMNALFRATSTDRRERSGTSWRRWTGLRATSRMPWSAGPLEPRNPRLRQSLRHSRIHTSRAFTAVHDGSARWCYTVVAGWPWRCGPPRPRFRGRPRRPTGDLIRGATGFEVKPDGTSTRRRTRPRHIARQLRGEVHRRDSTAAERYRARPRAGDNQTPDSDLE